MKRRHVSRAALLGLALPLLALTPLLLTKPAAADGPPGAVQLRGAGATFPAPLYYRWTEHFAKTTPSVAITYDAVGSGEGLQRFAAGTVDFAGSDALPSEADVKRMPRGAVIVPATAGMIILAYNLPNLGGPLKLPRDVYVDLLLGKITSWDDARIKKANPGLTLPTRSIALVARLDKSGTTNALTSHLSAISEDWRTGPGAGTWIEWPRNPMLARGNEGVAARIKISEGAVGYVEYGFAKRLGLPMAVLENKAGKFVAADDAAGQSALAENPGAPMIDPAKPESYPLVTYSWLLLPRQEADTTKRMALKAFIGWGLGDGQRLAPELGYLPLPASVVTQAKGALDTLP